MAEVVSQFSSESFSTDWKDQYRKCDICLNKFCKKIILPCSHKCCEVCYNKIVSCRMCESGRKKVNPMKGDIDIYFKINDNIHIVKSPIFYDPINQEVDFHLLNKTFYIMITIIEAYGFENYSHFTVDQYSVSEDNYTMDTIAEDDDTAVSNEILERLTMWNRDDIVNSCIDFDFVNSYVVSDLPTDKIQSISDNISKALLTRRFALLDLLY